MIFPNGRGEKMKNMRFLLIIVSVIATLGVLAFAQPYAVNAKVLLTSGSENIFSQGSQTNFTCLAEEEKTIEASTYCGKFDETYSSCLNGKKIVACVATCHVRRTYCDGKYLNQVIVCENIGAPNYYPNGDTCEKK